MLGKLLKHEFRATARVMLPLYLVLLAISLCGNFATRIMEHSSSQLLNLVGGLTIFAFFVGLMAVSLMSFFLMISRFHKNLLTDEGYLMFTLPVSVHGLIFSKIIVSTIWFIATGVVDLLAFLFLFFRVGYVQNFFHGLARLLEDMTSYYAVNFTALGAELLVLGILSCASLCLVVYASAALGHSFANHKILLSFAFFFGFSWISQFISLGGILVLDGMNFNFYMLENLTPVAQAHVMLLAFIAAELIYCAIFYVITAVTLQKRINLE